MNEEVRLAGDALKVADLVSVDTAEVPFADPIAHEVGGKCVSFGDHAPEVLGGPILRVVREEVGLAVSADVGRKELVVAGKTAPSRHIAIIAVGQLQPRASGPEHPEIAYAPV